MKQRINKKALVSVIGILGTLACIAIFIKEPSFPTPDKLFVFLVFVFMIFNQAWDMMKKFIPFIAILLVYDSFRGLVPFLNNHVNYHFMAEFDAFLFGGTLPTVTLQQWLIHGPIAWYDYMFYISYMLHFVLPLGLAVLVFKFRAHDYWRYALTFITASFTAFFIYLAFPAAPPWMATLNGTIPPINRISSSVFSSLGITDFPSVYNSIAPNAVAAVPSLHCAYAIIFSMFVFRYFGRKWGMISAIYPSLILFGVVYMGEHYVFDVITGALLAVVAYNVVPYLIRRLQPTVLRARRWASNTWTLLLEDDAKYA